MAKWQGFTQDLQTPMDLLRKMEHDLRRLVADPMDTLAAFDFFVAAEHMVDWRYPIAGDPGRKLVRGHEPGKTVSHLATGAKHFVATDARHASVADLAKEEDFGTAVLGRARLGEMVLGSSGRPAMIVTASDGRRFEAMDLARLVFAYWQKELGPGGMHEWPPP